MGGGFNRNDVEKLFTNNFYQNILTESKLWYILLIKKYYPLKEKIVDFLHLKGYSIDEMNEILKKWEEQLIPITNKL